MKGLIYKDICCMKKSLKVFFNVTLGVIILAALFVLSSRCGNVAYAVEQLASTGELTEEEFFRIYEMAIWIILFIPNAFAGNIIDCFRDDRRAGFAKTVLCMPVTKHRLVGSRYISCLIYAVFGFLGTGIAAFVVTLSSDAFGLTELLSVEFVLASLFLIYIAVIMMFLYLLGPEKADMIQATPFVLLLIGVIVYVNIILYRVPEEEIGSYLMTRIDFLKHVILHNAWVFGIAALITVLITYVLSVKIIERKGGINI